jgi:hypothetical protein
MINIFRSFRSHVAPAILAGYALYHSIGIVASLRDSTERSAGTDIITAFDSRFAPLKARLSAERCREIGYVTDEPENADWFTDFFRTQYALAPILVDDSTDHGLIVANLRDPSTVASILRTKHLRIISDYGNGVVLLSRELH